MVIGAARSGTTWAANWLTTEHTLCLHDPLFSYRYDELDSIPHDRPLGVSCTGLWAHPVFVNAHPARKLILHRDAGEINASLRRIGLPECRDLTSELNGLWGGEKVYHCQWDQLFHEGSARLIWEHLTDSIPFDVVRWRALKEFEIGPRYQSLVIDTSKIKSMLKELAA